MWSQLCVHAVKARRGYTACTMHPACLGFIRLPSGSSSLSHGLGRSATSLLAQYCRARESSNISVHVRKKRKKGKRNGERGSRPSPSATEASCQQTHLPLRSASSSQLGMLCCLGGFIHLQPIAKMPARCLAAKQDQHTVVGTMRAHN